MKKLKVAMLGAGSGFVMTIAKELPNFPVFSDCEFMLMDPAEERLAVAEKTVKEMLEGAANNVTVKASTDLRIALTDADHVITSCEKNRYAYWAQDFALAEKHGIFQIKAENGGPGGLIHGLCNICLYKEILEMMAQVCPDAWLMNFSNPMSILCTYFKNYFPGIKALGFCHQVHGSFGVIAEQLGMEPGELEVITAGINHCNWLFDIRKRGTGKSYMKEFVDGFMHSKWWSEVHPNVPEQSLSKKLYQLFKMYPVGYDEHIVEYLCFMQDKEQWPAYGLKSLRAFYEGLTQKKSHTLETQRLLGKNYVKPPFPADPDHPYYAENPCRVIAALETNTPMYFDAINIRNNGAVDNLPDDVILDVPALAIGGQVRSIHVGRLPMGPAEICRRQTVLHEMIAQACAEGDDDLVIQALCLDPYVGSLHKAENLWADYKKAYKVELTTFKH
ncbi:MAG: hypothetical protein GX927_11920 [Lentisphaerae bacterium]|nr:hypothetical protein [Lentisphaerota bacterium]